MGRLIDTDDLLNQLGLEDTDDNREENVGEIITLEDLDRVPTAYDIDNVVKAIQEKCKKFCDNIECDENCMHCEQYAIINAVIEAVKQGGVER